MPILLRSTRRKKSVLGAEEIVGGEVWERCAKIRPEILVPGYWDALQRNCEQWADEISVCPFWKAVKKEAPAWGKAFAEKTGGGELSAQPDLPTFLGKGSKRIKEKIVSSVSQNSPESFWSAKGAPVPLLNDLVRVRIQCQFLDGVEFYASCLEQIALRDNIHYARERQGRIQGYFFQHFCFKQNVFFRWAKSDQPTTINCEVQIATALATRVWEESHGTYEKWRTRPDETDDWQWDPEDPRFVARQLGHMIHLADGLLVQLRNTTRQNKI